MIVLHESSTIQESISEILEKLSTHIQAKEGTYCMALAGGSTPKKLYEAMSQQSWPWERLQLTLTDERWVDEDDQQSNAAMVKKYLLKDRAQSAYFLPLKNSEANPLEGQQTCETNLVTQMPRLNAVILGMGEDGHFASIFPEMDKLDSALDIENSALCMAAIRAEKNALPALERMTLTLPYLVSATDIYLLCTGDKKKAVLDAVMSKEGNQYPLQSLANKCEGHLTDTQLHIYWSPT